jgi:hypothetical protein
MSEVNNDESIADVPTESVTAQVPVEPTLRARISTWLSKRALSSVIVASVAALLIGIGIGHISTVHHKRDHFGNHQMRPDFDRDGRGPGMMGPGYGQFGPGNGQGGPGMMGPGYGPDDRGPDVNGPGNGPGQDGPVVPLPSASAETN